MDLSGVEGPRINLPRFVLLCALFFSIATESALAQESALSPDLNLLNRRVQEFWTLLQGGRKAEALDYVEPSTRDHFLNWKPFPFSSFVIRGISFGEDPSLVEVTVEARVEPTILPAPVDWSVTQSYHFREGNWYLEARPSQAKGLFGSSSPAPLVTESEQEQIEAELARFQLDPWHLDVGEIRMGGFWKDIPYRYDGDADVMVEVVNTPAWLTLDVAKFVLRPARPGGKAGQLRLRIGAVQEGRIQGQVVFRIRSGRVEISRELTVEGFVKARVTIIPRPVTLEEGASGQDITVRNNLSEELKIRGVVLSTGFLSVEPTDLAGAVIPPGETLSFRLEWDPARLPERWREGSIQLTLARVVEGLSTIWIPLRRSTP